MSAKVATQNIENRQAILTIEVEPERVQKSQQEAARRIAKRTHIPGFRKGKAPYTVVERTVGEEAIFDEALESLSREVYREALDQTGLNPIATAQVEVAERPPNGGLTLRVTLPLEPKVELGDYRSLRVEPKPIVVENAEVEKVLENLREDQAQWVPVERGAQNTDLLVLDIEGRAGDQVVMDVKKGNYVLNLGSGVPVAGFPELIEGMKSGEIREFARTYPADYEDKELAGRTVHFKVQVHEVKEKSLPPLDDDFAKSVGDFADLGTLRARIRELVQTQKEAEEEERIISQALSALIAQAKIEYPPALLDHELAHVREDFAHALSHRGFTLNRYLEVSGKTLEGLQEELRPQAEERLKRSLVLGELAKAEGLSVEEEEVEEEVEEIASSYGGQAEAIKRALQKPEPHLDLHSRLLSRKVTKRILEIVGQKENK